MNFAEFWHLITTSRYTRKLEQDNEQLRQDVLSLREENKLLVTALSPAVRATIKPLTPVSKAAPQRLDQPFRSKGKSWRDIRLERERQNDPEPAIERRLRNNTEAIS